MILFLALLFAADMSETAAPSLDHPAIHYREGPSKDPVALLNQEQLKFEGPSGYLRSVLAALHIPTESQIAVFSKTSLQAPRIEPRTPRTIFFNDSVAVAWMKGGFIELAALDPQRGVQFYKLDQSSYGRPRVEASRDCLRCHVGDTSLGVPGMIVRSTYTAPDGSPMLIYGGSVVDHRTPIEDRWGGWYVTGSPFSSLGAVRHLGNAVIGPQGDPQAMESLPAKIDTSVYLSPYSDVAALLVFDHQMHMINLITRFGWDVRAAGSASDRMLAESAREFVDYLLFVDEAPLPGPLSGRFETSFSKNGPRDSKGRSLRDLDLKSRLLRYPCSYMIYSDAFDALPASARDAIYQRMWQVLSGAEKDKRYARLKTADRRAIVEILRETKNGLPDYFQVLK